MSDPERDAVSELAATEIVTEPFPDPDAPPVTLTNDELLDAVQLQPDPCTLTTLSEYVPPPAPTSIWAGATPNPHGTDGDGEGEGDVGGDVGGGDADPPPS